MKSIRQSLLSLALLAFSGSAAALESAQDATALHAPLPVHASLYTFADVFRLTAGGAAMPEYPVAPAVRGAQNTQNTHNIPVALASAAAPAPTALAAGQPQAPYTFSIGAVPRPERWLLILSGLALGGWVARRRLGYSF
jgi:hypothetical protein